MFNTTVAWITLRATLSRRRALLFALPAVMLILLTAALKASHPPMRLWPSHVLGTFGFSVLIPLPALIIGTSVLGAEIDEALEPCGEELLGAVLAQPDDLLDAGDTDP